MKAIAEHGVVVEAAISEAENTCLLSACSKVRRRPWWLSTGLTAAIFLAAILGWAHWRFGSVTTARAYYSGQAVTVRISEAPRLVGNQKRAEFPLLVRNNSPNPVLIVGAEVACNCAVVGGLPITLPPLGSGQLQVSAAIGTARVILYTDAGPFSIEITVTPDKATAVSS